MTVRAKFTCTGITQRAWERNKINAVEVQLTPVFSNDPDSENHKFWASTPAGLINLTISNPVAYATFEVGREYYVDFTAAEE